MNTTTTTTTHAAIMGLAVRATAGTLKRIYDASGSDTIRALRAGLQADLHHLAALSRNMDLATTLAVNVNPKSNAYGLYESIVINPDAAEYADKAINDYVLSDAYDLLTVAYSYLYKRIAVDGMDAQDDETRTLKDGTKKKRTIYQWACVEVRKAVYAEKSIENNGKYTYIEDLAQDGETAENALDRHYIRLGKYYDMGGAVGGGEIASGLDGIYTADNATVDGVQSMLNALNLTARQRLIIKYRMQGLSTVTIADKLNVSHQAVSKTIAQVQDKVSALYPDTVRAFKGKRDR